MASADVGGSSTVPLTFSQGLAVLCSVLGVYSLLFTVRSSGVALLACVSSLLQVVCGISSCWSLSGLERVVGLFGFPLPSRLFYFFFHSWNGRSGFLSERWRGAARCSLQSGGSTSVETANKVV